MDADSRRRLAEAVEQARARAAEAVRELERDDEAPRSVQSAIREAEEALGRLAEELKADA